MWHLPTTCAAFVVWTGMVGVAIGQSQPKPPAQSDNDLAGLVRRLGERLDAMESQHESDQRRIEELEQRLNQLQQSTSGTARDQEIERIKEEIKTELGEPQPSSGIFDLSPSGFGTSNQMNPPITVFFDGGGSVSSRGANKALNRFNLREVELDLRAAISPSADGVVILTLEEEIGQSVRGDINVGRNVDIEESYINFHSLPHDLSLKMGKFRNLFGMNNVLHTHDLPQIDRPLAVQNFLGPEGLLTTGASLSWLVPNPWDKYVEATVQVVNSDGGDGSPILGGPNADNPAVVGHVKYFDDLTDTSSIEIGGSYLFGSTSRDSDFDANMFGLDVTYQWVDPDPSKFHSWVVQSELFWAKNDIDHGAFLSERNTSFGGYVFAQSQINRDWYVGCRADYSEFPNSDSRGDGDSDFALSPYVTWYISEFLRARLEYQHRWFDRDGFRDRSPDSEDVVLLQFTGVIGAHPPHPYWVNR